MYHDIQNLLDGCHPAGGDLGLVWYPLASQFLHWSSVQFWTAGGGGLGEAAGGPVVFHAGGTPGGAFAMVMLIAGDG